MPRLQVQTHSRTHHYDIIIGRSVLRDAGKEARKVLDHTRRAILISNKKVFAAHGAAALRSFKASKFDVDVLLIGDGEQFKSLQTAAKLLRELSEIGVERTDCIVALGGGVVTDVAGFVAAVYLRGIPLIQIPTTLLAQIDSSVGGKTGVDLPRGKNLVGSFHQPSLVITDIETLTTLPLRELRSGWCECVKQGAVASEDLFHQTTEFLETLSQRSLLSASLEDLILAHCEFKASIVKSDEREDVSRKDRGSRRILNFGHTVGHALEAATRYRRFRHGEAVGYGMLVAGELSKNLGLLSQTELESLQGAVELCGPLPRADDLDPGKLIELMKSDKKKAFGQIQWVLLEGIGQPRIVAGSKVSRLLQRALRVGLTRK